MFLHIDKSGKMQFGKISSVVYLVILENQGIISGYHYINECHNFYSSAFGTVKAVSDLAEDCNVSGSFNLELPRSQAQRDYFPPKICILQILYLFVKDLLSACYKKKSPLVVQNWTSTCPRFISQIRGPQVFLKIQ